MSPTMYFVRYCLIFLVASLLTLPLHAQELIFRSGFEPGSALVNQTSKTAQFTGVDQSVAPPNDWTKVKNHPSVGRLEIQYKDRDEKQQNKRRAEITSDPTGSGRGQVLKYWITGRNDTSNGRIQMNAYEGKEGFKEYYERFKIYLPSESFAPLKASSNSFDFLTIIEIWNNKNWDPDFGKPGAYPYRMNVNITKPSGAGKGLYLRAIGEQQSKGCCWGEGGDKKWEVTSEYPLPLDTWLDMEFYVKEGNATTGKLQMAVTPPGGTKQMLFNVTGWTRHPDDPKPDGIKYANPLKLYTNSTINTVVAAGDSLKLYWDDFELWKNKKIDFTPGPGGGANCSPTNWNNTSFVQPSDILVAEWETTPGANNMNGVIGLSDGEASAYNDLACIVRFNKEGNIDARNGSTYSANQTIAYEKDKAYRVRVEANLVNHTYNAYVIPGGGSEQTIGTNFAFRTEQSTTGQLNNYAINTESGCLQVDKFTATSPGSGNVTVRARGTTGSEEIVIRYNDQRVGERITLSTSFQEYKVQVNNANGNFKVAFVNDNGEQDVFVDWLQVDDERREAEDQTTNTGAWGNGRCGGGTLTEVLHCNGYIDFGTIEEENNAPPANQESVRSCAYDSYTPLDDRWSANYWESDIFEGQVCRAAAQDGSSLYADVDHTSGGWDIALTYNYKDHIRVDDIPAGFTVNGRIETNLTTVDNGLWWAGPKIDIRREGSSGLEGNYENYIIENASLSPDAFHNRLVSEGADYIGTTTHDGATYKHYYDTHRDWSQYWAVRQGYRTAGGVSLRPVLQKWRNHGMRNDYIRNMRMNIEASRNSQGSVAISDFATPLPGQSPPSAESGRILIRARSSQGGEEMVLEVAGEVVKRWDDVSVDPDNYIYDGYRGGEIKVIFDDNGGSRDEGTDRNLGINYIDVCGVRYEGNGEGVTRTNCGDDNVKGFAWLYCNGSLNFGDVGCNPSARVSTNPSKASALSQEPLAGFKTYPNPASERLTIAGGEDYQVTLYDMAGRRMMQHDHLSGKAELDIRHLRPGVYLLKLRDDQQHELRQRVVIE